MKQGIDCSGIWDTTLLKVKACISMWSASHSGHESVIVTVIDCEELHRPCRIIWYNRTSKRRILLLLTRALISEANSVPGCGPYVEANYARNLYGLGKTRCIDTIWTSYQCSTLANVIFGLKLLWRRNCSAYTGNWGYTLTANCPALFMHWISKHCPQPPDGPAAANWLEGDKAATVQYG